MQGKENLFKVSCSMMAIFVVLRINEVIAMG